MKSIIDSFRRKTDRYAKKPILGKIIFLSIGILTTVWFLIRVIPKPQRATYPCMQASAPFMSAFVVYLLTLAGSLKAFSLALLNLKRARYFYFGIFMILAVAGSITFFVQNPVHVFASSSPEWIITPNAPIGISKGIHPGRVTWVHNPKAATWDGSTGFWWDDAYNPQAETDKMMN